MDRKVGKNILKICLFIILANLPFVTIAHQIGIDAFLDSFDHPECYLILRDSALSNDAYLQQSNYVLIQRSSHPEFSTNENDVVLYYNDKGGLCCNKIYHITRRLPIKKYYTVGYYGLPSEPIYENHVIGKVIGVIDDNIWNSLSIKTWELSLDNLNIRALFTDN